MRRRDDPKLSQWSTEKQEDPCVVGDWLIFWKFGKFFTNIDFFGKARAPPRSHQAIQPPSGEVSPRRRAKSPPGQTAPPPAPIPASGRQRLPP